MHPHAFAASFIPPACLPQEKRSAARFKYRLLLIAMMVPALAFAAPDCREQKVDQTLIEMCRFPGGFFQHDTYVLRADKVTVFALADDFAENVTLNHTVPEAAAVEFALSHQDSKNVLIKGGCVPVSKDQLEIARICNFTWGQKQVVKDVRFDID
jgi:hypothetical protein